MLESIFVSIYGESLAGVMLIGARFLFFVVAPVVLVWFFVVLWGHIHRAEFLSQQKTVMLEIKLPRDIFKSPMAMELLLTNLNIKGGESTWYDRYFLGKARPWFSLELASIEGDIRFFIWTWDKWRNYVESQIYAQYPDVEIYESPDYTQSFYFDPEKNSLWGCRFELAKPDPYPIKTYAEYGLDKPQEEEEKVDPITPLIEFMGSLGKGQQMWAQIMIRAHKDDRPKKGKLFGKTDWKDEAKEAIEQIKKDAMPKDTSTISMPMFTDEQKELVAAIERSLSKSAFEVGIRALYLADNDNFDGTKIPGMISSFTQFNSNTRNGFKPAGGLTGFNYPWSDYKEMRQNRVRRKILDAFKRRSYFHPPYKTKHFILCSEELATMYHFPGLVAATPTFTRISSKKSGPPSNLPIDGN